MSHELIRLIDAWAANTKTTRSESIRRLVEQALLKDDPGQKQAARKTGSRTPAPREGAGAVAKMITASGLGTSKKSSQQMAAEAIDRLGDKSASVEEKERRKRRLIKGPPEFRDMRGDLPKRKD